MRMKRLMVAIISVMLILVTAISFSTLDAAAAAVMPEVSSSSYVVMSGSTSEIVVDKHADRKMQPGKITMLMTAMVVIDNSYNNEELNNTVDISHKLAGYGDLFKEGETVTVRDLLTAMLVGGDVQSAEALSRYSTSSRKIFINEMNSKCMELGIMDTLFKNPGGTYKTTQYSTAKDLAVITQAAIRYQLVKDTLKQPSAAIHAKAPDGTEREIVVTSTNPLLVGDENQVYKYVKGGIAGMTEPPVNAAQFAAVATKDDMQLIVVLMDSKPEMIAAEARGLFIYGDDHVTKNTIVKKGKKEGHARVRNGAVTRVPAYTETKGFAYVPPEGSDKLIQTRVVMFDNLEAPLRKGEKVGEFRIYVADELKGTVDLVTKKEVPVGWFPSRFYISNRAVIAFGVILALIILFFIRVETVRARRARRREAMRRQKIRELARKQLEIDEDRKKRNWNGRGYEPLPPRTTDIRRENLNNALNEDARRKKK